jgi:hypothetical protein
MKKHAGSILLIVMSVSVAMRCSVALAQDASRVKITGRVIDDSTRAPVVNANVFIANSMIGTSSDTSGSFVLRNVPAGFYELVASCVGYTMSTVKLQLTQGPDQQVEMHLVPKVLSVDVVEVLGLQPEVWKEDLKTFEKLLLGSTKEASECRIVNPEVLDFSTDPLGHFRARTDRQVTIENLATGYRLHMSLGAFSFDGRWLSSDYRIRYEEIQPLDTDVRSKWSSRRDNVYAGSLHHFFVALVNDELADQGFSMFDTESLGKVMGDYPLYELKRYDILKQSSPNEWTLRFRKYLVVTYDRKQIALEGNQPAPEPRRFREYSAPGTRLRSTRPMLSILSLPKGSVLIDSHGQILNQLALRISGDWAKEGLASQLPLEFQPGSKR